MLTPKMCHIFRMGRPINSNLVYTVHRLSMKTCIIDKRYDLKGQCRKVMWCIWQVLSHKSRTKSPRNTRIGFCLYSTGNNVQQSSWAFPFGRYNALSVSAFFSRAGDLDFWPSTLKLVRIIACGVTVPFSFHSRLIDQHLSDVPRDLATFTFDLEGYGACRWYRSSSSICTPIFWTS